MEHVLGVGREFENEGAGCSRSPLRLSQEASPHLVINLRWGSDQGGAEGGDAVRQDPPGHQGNPRTYVLRGLGEVNTKSTCGHRKGGVAWSSDLFPWVPLPAPSRTVNLHVDETGRQDAAPAVPPLVGHAPLLKEQLLRVQDAASAHPQILPADGAGGCSHRGPDLGPVPCTPPVPVPAPFTLPGPRPHRPQPAPT